MTRCRITASDGGDGSRSRPAGDWVYLVLYLPKTYNATGSVGVRRGKARHASREGRPMVTRHQKIILSEMRAGRRWRLVGLLCRLQVQPRDKI
jgi:hypothetical protein